MKREEEMEDVRNRMDEIAKSCNLIVQKYEVPKGLAKIIRIMARNAVGIRNLFVAYRKLPEDFRYERVLTPQELIEMLVEGISELSRRGIDFRKAIIREYKDQHEKDGGSEDV